MGKLILIRLPVNITMFLASYTCYAQWNLDYTNLTDLQKVTVSCKRNEICVHTGNVHAALFATDTIYS